MFLNRRLNDFEALATNEVQQQAAGACRWVAAAAAFREWEPLKKGTVVPVR